MGSLLTRGNKSKDKGLDVHKYRTRLYFNNEVEERHTAIVVHGKEYFFGGEGINSCSLGGTPLGEPDSIVDLGHTEVPADIFIEYLTSLAESTYRGDKYNLFEHNCNTFSNELAQFLTDKKIPSYITDLPSDILSTSSIHPSIGLIKDIRHVLYAPLPPGRVAVSSSGDVHGGGGVPRGRGLPVDVATSRLPGFEGRAGEVRVCGGLGEMRMLQMPGRDGDGQGGMVAVMCWQGLVDVGLLFGRHRNRLEGRRCHRAFGKVVQCNACKLHMCQSKLDSSTGVATVTQGARLMFNERFRALVQVTVPLTLSRDDLKGALGRIPSVNNLGLFIKNKIDSFALILGIMYVEASNVDKDCSGGE
ncbi:hypothetical protein F2P81_022046 [Scophthalmus maximus]|uniref:palmitoyl-protein hydrolase n=1 Tax=Scophthalmus maximus TaxID=52904 RepID=A0A6A4RYP8_SCOMX|nr:hypothetical protein F2P81_022046 [Scophthalmus maximus]